MDASEPPLALSAVAEVFAQFLAAREQGAGDDIEPWCEAHPRVADRLRRMHADWAGLEAALGPGRGADSRDRYEIGPCLAEGGMGTVYRVYDHHLRRELAMKLLRGERPAGGGKGSSDPRSLSRFLDEARITGQLQHPGIPAVHDLGIDRDGRVFFTMPLIAGSTLKEVVERLHRGDREWTLARVLGVLLKVCDAVAFAHAQGVIHRDLKPGNVMIGRFGEAYVMDWGLARVLGDDGDEAAAAAVSSDRASIAASDPGSPLVTRQGDVVGTPAYMPPEQARGDLVRLGPRADVYALGAMLYHVLAGAPPYGDPPASSTRAVRRVLAGGPAPLAEVAPETPAELAAICARAMAARPEDRYADVGELAADLRAWLEVRVVRAYQSGAFASLRKLVRRNKAVAFAFAGALLAMVAGTIVSVQQANAASRSAELAVAAVDRGLERVASSDLEDVPRAYPVRQGLLEDAIALYETILRLRDDDTETRVRLARCWNWLGRVRNKLGDVTGAAAAQDRAIELYARLASEGPGEDEYVAAGASARVSLASVLEDRGETAAAEAQFRAAAEALAGVAAPRDRGRHFAQRSTVQGQLGSLLLALGRRDEALGAKQQMVAFARAAAECDASDKARETLARSLDQLGHTLYEVGRPNDAMPCHEEAIAVLAALHEGDPASERFCISYAAALNNHARCLDVAGRDDEAVREWERSAALWQRAVDEHPGVPTYHSNLGTTQGNIARVVGDKATAARRWEAAVRAHAAACTLAPDHLGFRAERLRHLRGQMMWLCRERRHKEVVAAAAELAAAVPADPTPALQAATFVMHAVGAAGDDAAVVAEYRTAAVSHLRAAFARGCRDRRSFEAGHLASLRGDPAYDALLAELGG